MDTTKRKARKPEHFRPVASRDYKVELYPPETPVERLPELLTSGQTAAWLDVSRKAVANMADRGDLHRLQALNRRFVLFARDEVAEYRRRDVRWLRKQAARQAS